MSRLPAIQNRLNLDIDQLGMALGALGLGTILGMLGTGRLSVRFGSRRVILGAALGAAVTLVAIPFAATAWALAGVLLAFGLAVGAWDAGMNIHGAAVAQAYGGHLMTRFHGFWSIGSVVGAGSGVVAARGGVPVGVQCLAVAIVSLALAGFGARVDVGGPPPDDRKRVRVTRRLVMLGSLILAGGFIEGAANDWLAVLLARERSFTHARAAGAYAVFVGAMTAGRFAAERLYHRMPPDRLVRWGALLAGVGVIVTVLTPVDVTVYAGAAIWGIGICIVFPVVIGAGGAEPGAEQIVGALTTIGYGAGLIGPLLLGVLAEQIRLGTSLLSLPAIALALAWLATSLRPASERGPEP
jgi:fucose permease